MDFALKILILQFASDYKLDSDLLFAVIETESAGNKYAMRYEEAYPWLYEVTKMAKAVGCTTSTMKMMQRTSYGLMQIMGGVAYENKFRGWGAELCNPEINLEYGCKHLKKMVDRYGPSPSDSYAAYNSGSVRMIYKDVYVNQRAVTNFRKNYQEVLLRVPFESGE